MIMHVLLVLIVFLSEYMRTKPDMLLNIEPTTISAESTQTYTNSTHSMQQCNNSVILLTCTTFVIFTAEI